MSEIVFVYITVGSEEDARDIAQTLVEEKLAACANIVPGVTSFFRWEGKVQESEEFVVIAKTAAARFEKLQKRVAKLHSYDTPCIVALPVEAGHKPFLSWISKELA